MLVSLTVGKVDAGVAVLLTDDKRLIEFPSILLPPNISSGSIVDITVSRNLTSEAQSQAAFTALQDEIYTCFGQHSPSAPILRCRNATQTSVVLEWEPLELAEAELRGLSLYRNGNKAGNIPRPLDTKMTKISGLGVDTEYTFHLLLRTSAGTYSSEKLTLKTHKMTDLSGITVTPGILAPPLRDSLQRAVERIGGKLSDTVEIDTTHFVCTEGRGPQWERAVEMNIPVVRPEWVEGCEREGRMVGVRGYYLNADPRLRQVGQGVGLQQAPSQSQQSIGSSQASPVRSMPVRQQSQPSTERLGEQQSHHAASGQNTTVATSTPVDEEDRPPTPPAKDDAVDGDAESEEDEDEETAKVDDPSAKSSGLKKPGHAETESDEEEDRERIPGDGGSFSEVAL
ncbi:MAG: Chitin synthase, class 5 [Caeruleum heppii]|nr:MAG: Chitin synthase, class 5 [Caeruleum heppii]